MTKVKGEQVYMKLDLHKQNISKQLEKMTEKQALVFGIKCVERNIPVFNELSKKRDIRKLNKVMESINESIYDDKELEEDVIEVVEKLYHEDFEEDIEEIRNQCIGAVMTFIEDISDDKKEAAFAAADFNFDILDAYMFIKYDDMEVNEVEEMFEEHPLVQAEITFQAEMLNEIMAQKETSDMEKWAKSKPAGCILGSDWMV